MAAPEGHSVLTEDTEAAGLCSQSAASAQRSKTKGNLQGTKGGSGRDGALEVGALKK